MLVLKFWHILWWDHNIRRRCILLENLYQEQFGQQRSLKPVSEDLSAQELSFLDNTLLKCLFILVIPSLNIVCRYWVIYSDVRNASAVLQPHHPSSPLTRSSRLWHTETNSAHSVTSSGHQVHWATSFIIRAANDSSVFTITEKAINTMLNARWPHGK